MGPLELIVFHDLTDDTPSVRMRFLMMRQALERHGIRLDIRNDLSGQKWFYGLRSAAPLRTWPRWRALARFAVHEAAERGAWIVNHRLCRFSPFVHTLYTTARAANVPVIYDIDDAVYLPDKWVSPARRFLSALLEPNISRFVFRNSTAVTAATRAIAERAARWNRHVTRIATPVDTSLFQPLPKPGEALSTRNALVLGYSGNVYSHAADLRLILPVLDELSRHHSVTCRLACTGESPVVEEFISLLDGRARFEIHRQLPYDRMPEFYNGLDVNMVPLVNDEFNRARCSTKLTEAMACSVPCVASRVGFHSEAVEQGVTGFLAGTTAEWVACIDRLARAPELRKEIGKAARQKIETHYSVNAVSRQEADFLHSLAEERRHQQCS